MPSRHREHLAEQRALSAYVTLMRAAESVSLRTHDHLKKSALTVGQFGVLEALYHLGPMRQIDLARKLLRSPGNVTTVIDNLQRRRLIRRNACPGDRRCTTVTLTAAGQRLIGRLFPIHAAVIAADMRVLSPDELSVLHRLCKKLGLRQTGS